MQRRLACVCLLLLAGCGQDTKTPASPTQPAESAAADSTRVTVFADSNLEAAVRLALVRATGILTDQDLLGLTQLVARDRSIASLAGIDSLKYLQVLDLADNQIADISPLAPLTRLTFLDLTSNQVQDLSPLAGLDSLESLMLDLNPIHDLGPLLGLEKLRWLEVLGTPLTRTAQELQVPALRARGVEVTFSEAQVDTQVPGIPDNQTRILFQSDREGNLLQLYTVRPDGSDLKQVNSSDFYDFLSQPKVSPQQDRVAFANPTPERDGEDIYVSDLDGSNLRNLTQDLPGALAKSKVNFMPSWSPEGSRIAFFASGEAAGLWMIDADGSNPLRVVQDKELVLKMGPYLSLSPRWDRIAFLSSDGARLGTKALYISDINGTNWTRVVDAVVDLKSEYRSTYIVWSPDEQKIAFVSNRDGNKELYVVNVDGSNLTRLTHDDDYDAACVWSPDGHWLAFDTNREAHRWEVYVVDVEGNNTYNLTNSFANDYVCDWLADR